MMNRYLNGHLSKGLFCINRPPLGIKHVTSSSSIQFPVSSCAILRQEMEKLNWYFLLMYVISYTETKFVSTAV